MIYRKEIDGLRAISVTSVVLFHSGFENFSGGYVGVDVFFVISGYVISWMLIEKNISGDMALLPFIERRIRRIMPLLILVVFVSAIFAYYIFDLQEMQSFSQSAFASILFISNITFWNETGYFDSSLYFKPLIHTWSLSIEFQSYLILFAVFIVFYKGKINLFIFIIVIILSFSIFLCIYWAIYHNPQTAFFWTPTRIWQILSGAFAAIIIHKKRNLIKSRYYSDILSITGLIIIFLCVHFYDEQIIYPGYYAIAPVIGAILVIVFSNKENITGKLLSYKPIVFIGLISYGIYLWHQPIFTFFRHIYGEEISNSESIILIVITIIMSSVTWRYIEGPFRDIKIINSKRLYSIIVISMTIIFIFAVVSYYTHGIINRFEKYNHSILLQHKESPYYIVKRFNEKILKKFDEESKKKKILVIGDSFGQDLVNALYEGSFQSKVQISTFFISSRCGNIIKPYESRKIHNEKDYKFCEKQDKIGNNYENKELQKLIAKSDYVFLASNWKKWVIEMLPSSIQEMESIYGEKFIVYGGKSIGAYNIKEIIRVPKNYRKNYYKVIDNEFIKNNDVIEKMVGTEKFVNVHKMICVNEKRCRVFDNESNIKSHDGGHLTKSGAIYLGKKLRKNIIIKTILLESE